MRFDIIYNNRIKLSISRDNAKQAGDFVKDIITGRVPEWKFLKEELEYVDISKIKIRTTKIEHIYYNLEGDKI